MQVSLGIIQGKLGPQYTQYTLDSPANTFPVNYPLLQYAQDMVLYAARYNQPDIMAKALPHITSLTRNFNWNAVVLLSLLNGNTTMSQAVEKQRSLVYKSNTDYTIEDTAAYRLLDATTMEWLVSQVPRYASIGKMYKDSPRDMRRVIQQDDLTKYLSIERTTYEAQRKPLEAHAFLVSDYLYAVQFDATKIAAHLKPQLPWGQLQLDPWWWLWYHISQPHEWGVLDPILDPVIVCPIMQQLLHPDKREDFFFQGFIKYERYEDQNTKLVIATWCVHYYHIYAQEINIDDAVSVATQWANYNKTAGHDANHIANFIYHTLCDVKYIQDPRLRRLLALVFQKFKFKVRNYVSVLLFYIYRVYITQQVPTVPFRRGPGVEYQQVTDDYIVHNQPEPLRRFKLTTGDSEILFLPDTRKTSTYFVSAQEDETGVQYMANVHKYYICQPHMVYYISRNKAGFDLVYLDFAPAGWLRGVVRN